VAKVTITIEDQLDDKGEPGLVIGWDSDNTSDTETVAENYAAAFIQFCKEGAGVVKDITHETLN
jgi:hypothetical protein